MADVQAILQAAREKRGPPPQPMTKPERAAELRKAADALDSGDDAVWHKLAALSLAEFCAVKETIDLIREISGITETNSNR